MDCPGGCHHLTLEGNERGRTYRADSDRVHFLELLEELAAEGVSRKDAKTQRWEEDEGAAVPIMAGNSCPPYGSLLAEAWDPSRILPLKQRTGGVVPEVLNRPAMGCDPFGIRSGER